MTREMEELIQKLADLTEMAFEDVEAELDDLVQRIRKEAKGGATYKVSGLGTFRELDDKLTFTPDEKLATEINYKYAGMEPIEIMAGFAEQEVDAEEQVQQEPSERSQRLEKEKGEESEPVGEEEPVTEEATVDTESQKDTDTEASEAEESPEVSEEKHPEQVESAAGSEEMKAEPEKAESKPDQKDQEKPESKKEEKPVTSKTDEKSEKTNDIPEKEEKTLTKAKTSDKKKDAKPKKKTKRKTVADRRGSQTTTWVILSAAAVVILAVVIWGLSQRGDTDQAKQAGMGTGEMASETTSKSDESNQKVIPMDEISEDDQANEQASKPETSEEDLPDSPVLNMDYDAPYGLKGIPSNQGMKGYTLVVFSFGRESNASRQADKLSEKGYRAIVDYVTLEDGTERWRVGVGQFATLDSARSASKRLPEPYKSDFFIKRIN
jgi:hypothetical protein